MCDKVWLCCKKLSLLLFNLHSGQFAAFDSQAITQASWNEWQQGKVIRLRLLLVNVMLYLSNNQVPTCLPLRYFSSKLDTAALHQGRKLLSHGAEKQWTPWIRNNMIVPIFLEGSRTSKHKESTVTRHNSFDRRIILWSWWRRPVLKHSRECLMVPVARIN